MEWIFGMLADRLADLAYQAREFRESGEVVEADDVIVEALESLLRDINPNTED